LKGRWVFSEEPEYKAVDDIDSDTVVDVINKAGDMVLRPAGKKEAETSDEAEASEKGRSLAKS
jgi:hypothetical protein